MTVTPWRRLGVLCVLGLTLPLAACSGDEPLPAGDAVEHYDTAADAVAEALGAAGTTWTLAEKGRSVREDDGRCRYTPGSWNPDSPLDVPQGDDAWQERIDAVSPALQEHGFAAVSKPSSEGSRQILETEDAHGASLSITAEGRIRIWDAEVAADPCTAQTLGIE